MSGSERIFTFATVLDPGLALRQIEAEFQDVWTSISAGGGGPGGGIPEAPTDGNLYGRVNATWGQIPAPIPGPAGAQGPAGPAGAQGTTGPVGPAGADGAAGPQGNAGAQGPAGAAGATGPQGAQGIQGTVGPQGAQGIQGTAGAPGPQGNPGATGPAGPGVVVGGTAGQVLTKNSATDYDTVWLTPAVTGGGNVSSSGTPVNGQLAQWIDATHIQGIAASSLGFAPLASPVFTGDPQAPTPLTADNDTSIATTAFVKAQGYLTASALASYAPLASPVFTGDPQAPTPATADNDTSIATTAFVKAQGYITSAALVTYAPLTSPAFTGNPTAPTAATADNTTSIATTAFVKAQGYLGGTPAALTKIDDTNVTLTLGGTPATALLQATSITVGWTGTLAAGRLNANVVQAVTNDANVTGSIASQTLTLGWAGTLANARLATMAAHTYKGNNTGATATPIDLTNSQLTADLNLFTSALQGLVPASGGGTTNFLRADGMFAAPAGGGGTSITISDTPPGSPTVGALWWESDTGKLWIYYNDGTSSQWIAVSGGSTTIAGVTPNYLGGLTLSNDVTTPNTVLDIATGCACSDDNTTMMSLLAAGFTKNCNAAWAVGSGNGARDVGSTLAASTWYHVFLIERTDTGVVDVLISTSATSPTMPTNYTKKRRIGSIFTDASANIRQFIQNGDEFLWVVAGGNPPPLEVNLTSTTTSYTLKTLTYTPPGIRVVVLLNVWFNSGTTAVVGVWVQAPDTNTNTGIGEAVCATGGASGNNAAAGRCQIRTNLSAQINYATGSALTGQANQSLVIFNHGWIDNRGK